MSPFLKITIAALFPVLAAVIFYLLENKTSFGKLKRPVRQIIYGVTFGGLAIVGTEWGIPINGAQVNCRDAAVLVAGLLFGAPAGIIAGTIGAVERWIAVAWGVGTFTRVACSVSTFIAGIYAALLRKYMFEDKKPDPFISLAAGVVMEVFHLTMVFITNVNAQDQAVEVVRVSTLPMVISNGISVGIAAMVLLLLAGGHSSVLERKNVQISQTIQRWLFITVLFAFLLCSGFMFRFQTISARKHAETLMDLALRETASDIGEELGESSVVTDITWNRHIGEEGYVLVYDQNGQLISAPYVTGRRLKVDLSGESLERRKENITYELTINGEKSYLRKRKYGGYQIAAIYLLSEALRPRDLGVYANAFLMILVLAVVFGMIYMLIKRVVVNRIDEVNRSLSKITGGDLNEVVNVRSNAEFASLSDDINATVDTLKMYIDEASKRIDKELEFAKSIQVAALPGVFPAFPKRHDLDIYALMDPAKEVGGDFYDFYFTGENTLNFLIADVSGKGIPAAMFMMRAKTELKSLTEAGLPLSEVFSGGNKALCEGNDAGMFVTAWQGSIDLATGHVQYVNAGHNPPLVRHEDGSFEYLKGRAGFVLAGMEGVKYRIQELDLAPGDIIFLYTDGVTEATDAENELYGEERLRSALNRENAATMELLAKGIKADVDRFYDGAPQFDDITILAFQYLGQDEREITFPEASLQNIPEGISFIEENLERMGAGMKTITTFDVAADEIMANIISYAYPEKPGPMTIRVYSRNGGRTVCLKFIDEGIPYNPLTHKDPDVTLSAEERGIGGLGIYMVKKTMDVVHYMYMDGKNILTVKKDI